VVGEEEQKEINYLFVWAEFEGLSLFLAGLGFDVKTLT
jgi:hypothetical protein